MSSRPVLSGPQQYILQIFMNRGVIDQFEFKDVFLKSLKKFDPSLENITTEQIPKDIYASFVTEIVEALKPYNMEIVKGVCEISGVTFYCFVRLFDSGIGRLSALYNATELKIFNSVLEMIFESDHGFVNFNSIVNQITETYLELSQQASTQSQVVKVPTNKDIRTIIEKFINDFWLVEILGQRDRITLHGRALIELDQYIKGIYDEDTLNICAFCKKIVLISNKCESCPCTYHRACYKEFFSKQRDCFSCKTSQSIEKIEENRTKLSNYKNIYQEKFSRN